MNNKVKFEISREEAIVLFEFLARNGDNGDKLNIEHESERNVIWSLECILEKRLPEIFKHDYSKVLKGAREKIDLRDK